MEKNKIEIVVGGFSRNTLGIKSKEGKWFNVEDMLPKDRIQEKISKLNVGDKIALTLPDPEMAVYVDFEIIEKSKGSFRDDYVGFDEILKKAHEKFGSRLSIKTEPFLDGDGKSILGTGWIFSASVTIDPEKDGREVQLFTAHGEATEDNVSNHLKTAIPRMAETRAVARALRFALGESTVKEEMPDANQ